MCCPKRCAGRFKEGTSEVGRRKGGSFKDLTGVELQRCIQKRAQIVIRGIRYNAAIYDASTVCISSPYLHSQLFQYLLISCAS